MVQFKRHQLKLLPFHGCQFGVVDANGLPMKKGWMIATNMEELSGLAKHICDGPHTHGQSRGVALKLAENYTFALTDFIHKCFQSRASKAQTAGKEIASCSRNDSANDWRTSTKQGHESGRFNYRAPAKQHDGVACLQEILG